MIRPDGEMLRIGDEFNEGTRYAGLGKTCFFGSYLYDDPVLKGFGKKELLEYSKFYVMSLTPVMILIFNPIPPILKSFSKSFSIPSAYAYG